MINAKPIIPENTTENNFQLAARVYHQWGFNVCAIKPGTKEPARKWKHWQTQRQTRQDVAQDDWQHAGGIGAFHAPVSGYLVCIDFDDATEHAPRVFLAAAGLPDDYRWLVRSGSGRGFHIWVRAPGLTLDKGKLNYVGRDCVHVELRWRGHQTLLPPSLHTSGGRYEFVNGTPTEPPATVDPAVLLAAYETVHTGEPYAQKRSTADRQTRPPASLGDDLTSRYRLYVRKAARAAWGFSDENERGFSANLRCPNPAHDDRNPSAAWDYTRDYVFCHACGGLCRDDVAALLGLQTFDEFCASERTACVNDGSKKPPGSLPDNARPLIAEQVKENQGQRTDILENLPKSSVNTHKEVASAAHGSSRFDRGLPFTLNKRLMTAHKRIGVEKQHAAAAVLALWQEIPESVIPGDAWFSRGDFETATQQTGRHARRDLIDKGLRQLIAWGMVETVENATLQPVDGEMSGFCNLHTGGYQLLRLQNQPIFSEPQTVSILRQKTRPMPLYRFKPIHEALTAFFDHYRYLLREEAFRGAPDTTRPEFGDLTPAQVAAWDDYRAPVLDADAAEHARALERLEKQIGYLENDLAHIQNGTNRAIVLPPGEVHNAGDYWRLLAQGRTCDQDVERPRLATDLGVSRSALARSYDQIGVVPIAQTRVMAADQVTDYQWESGLVVREFDNGQVEVKAPSLLRSRDRADETDLAAFDDQREQQANRRNLRQDIEPETEHARGPGFEAPPLPETVPENYTDAYKRRQYDLFPLPVEFSGFDPETGEVYTIDELWRVGSDWLIARERGETMPASHYNQPPEVEQPETGEQPEGVLATRGGDRKSNLNGSSLIKMLNHSMSTLSGAQIPRLQAEGVLLTAGGDGRNQYRGPSNGPTTLADYQISDQPTAPGLPAPANRCCDCCGAPATVTKLGGNFCQQHAELSLNERCALADDYQRQHPVMVGHTPLMVADAAR